MAQCDPVDGLDIAQPTRGFLDVGFEVVLGVAVTLVALPLLVALGAEELRRGPDLAGAGARLHVLFDARVAGDGAGFHQVGGDGDVGAGGGHAIAQGAHAVPHLELQVPECGDAAGDVFGIAAGAAAVGQDQHVDVGVGVQFAAAVAANREQRDAVVPAVPRPHGIDHQIHEGRAFGHQHPHRLAAAITQIEGLPRLVQQTAQLGQRRGRLHLGDQMRQCRSVIEGGHAQGHGAERIGHGAARIGQGAVRIRKIRRCVP